MPFYPILIRLHRFRKSAIENWDVSQITSMDSMFNEETSCNPNISTWDVSRVTNFVSYLWSLLSIIVTIIFGNANTHRVAHFHEISLRI